MKDIDLVGICPEATIRAAYIVRNEQIQALGNQFGACIIRQVVCFSSKAYTHQALFRPFIATLLVD